MLKLKKVLSDIGVTQNALAKNLELSPAAVAQLINHNQWPKHKPQSELKLSILEFLKGFDAANLSVFEEVELLCDNTTAPSATTSVTSNNNPSQEDLTMLLRKNRLSRTARDHFKLPRDPFTDEMREDSDVFLSEDIRYVRASMRQTAEHGGFMAIVGESGAGKSTLRQDLDEWVHTHNKSITVISPFSELGMEGDKPIGKPLKAQNIIESVIKTLSPLTQVRGSAEARVRQMHKMLCESAQAGYKHVLVIEEAHRLAIPTIKHLKQFYELQDGFKKLISIIMIGQTELEGRLSEFNPEIREVVQRCELVRLPALDDHLEAYIKHKFERIGVDYKTVLDTSAIDEMRNRLRTSVTEGRGSTRSVKTYSLCYPLAVNNLLSGAMNMAVSVHAPIVTDELISAAIRRE
jgi:type II secretory pathway predicted ATPase ExeA/predicted transcriptional regulator